MDGAPPIKAGFYNIELRMTIPDLYYEQTATSSFTVYSYLVGGHQLGNKITIILSNSLEIAGSFVNDPIDCEYIVNSGNMSMIMPNRCEHNGYILIIYASNDPASTLIQGSIIHIIPYSAFNTSINYTLENNLPGITISGGDLYDGTETIREIEGVPTDIEGFIPDYECTITSSPVHLDINSTFRTQNIYREDLIPGTYEFRIIMTLPYTYRYIKSSTASLIVKSKVEYTEQYGNRFIIYLTIRIKILDSWVNEPINCTEILEVESIELLGGSGVLCAHNMNILTVIATVQSTAMATNIISLKTQSAYATPQTIEIEDDLPKLSSLTATPLSPWEAENMNNISSVSLNIHKVKVEYSWKVLSGNPIPALIGYNESVIYLKRGEVAAGEYLIQQSMKVVLGAGFTSNLTLPLSVNVSTYTTWQNLSLINIRMTGNFYLEGSLLGSSDCSGIVHTLSYPSLGSDPLCEHVNSILKIYISNDSTILNGASLNLHHPYITTLEITHLKAPPSLLLFIPSLINDIYHYTTDLLLIQATILNTQHSHICAITWKQKNINPNTTTIYIGHNSNFVYSIPERSIKAGNYMITFSAVFDIDIVYGSVRKYEVYKEINFTYGSIPTANIMGGEVDMNFRAPLTLTANMSVDNDGGRIEDLEWTWESSTDPNFSVDAPPIMSYSGNTFSPREFSNKDLTVGSRQFKEGTYYFKLKLSKWTFYTAEAITKVNVFGEGPSLQIATSSPFLKYNPDTDICLQATAFSYDRYRIENSWQIKPFVKYELYEKKSKLCILAEDLKPGSSHTVIIRATEQSDGTSRELESTQKYYREKTIAIMVSKYPVITGGVEISPTVGVGITQNFEIRINNWYDPEGTKLSYMLLTKIIGSDTGFIAINSYTTQNIFNTFLPPGNYTIYIQ